MASGHAFVDLLDLVPFVNIGRGNRNLFEMPRYEIRSARYFHLK